MEVLLEGLTTMSAIELIAVVCGFLYVILATKENIWCWPPAFISSVLFFYVFTTSKLYFDGFLNVYYAGMAIYGYLKWNTHQASKPEISWGGIKLNLMILLFGSGVAFALGYGASNYSDASFPYFDAATTVFSLIATWMVTQKYLENWLYWILIDGLSIYLYLEKGLYFTSILFITYTVISVYGFINWKKNL